jgi:hypothetical protein
LWICGFGELWICGFEKQIYDAKVGMARGVKVYAGYNLGKRFGAWVLVSQSGNIYLCLKESDDRKIQGFVHRRSRRVSRFGRAKSKRKNHFQYQKSPSEK